MAPTVVAGLVVLLLTGCATIRAATTRSTEQMLAAAGFHVELADTPQKAARLRTLPPRKITVDRRDVEPRYVYADPDVCACTYVGTESQYKQYRRLVFEKELADEQLQESPSWGTWSWGRWWR